MAIFRRKDKTADTAESTAETTDETTDETTTDSSTDSVVESEAEDAPADDLTSDDSSDGDPADATEDSEDTDDGADAAEDTERAPRLDSRAVDRSNGPFDRSEVDDLDGYLDFGSLAIRPNGEMELRLDVDESGQEITGITAVIGESACQMQVFAAPKTSGVWDGIRGEIHDNLLASGGTAEDKVGELGHELHVRMPAAGPDGRTSWSPATFVGVDGPRWFLRAVFSGRAAMEDDAFAQLLEFMRATVVTRGQEPRAPREMLPLHLPEGAEQAAAEAAAAEGVPNPFERGPEITEVR